jgi:hypothetical protein
MLKIPLVEFGVDRVENGVENGSRQVCKTDFGCWQALIRYRFYNQQEVAVGTSASHSCRSGDVPHLPAAKIVEKERFSRLHDLELLRSNGIPTALKSEP